MKTASVKHSLGQKSQEGFAHIVALTLVIAVVVAAGALVMSRQKQQTEDSRRQKAAVAAQEQKEQTDIKSKTPVETVVPETTTPAAPAATTPSKTTSTSKPATSQPKPSMPALAPSVTFSSTDPCLVTITGTPGTNVEIGADNGHKGGSSPYVLPASGTITKSSGGTVLSPTMTAYGIIYGSTGETVLSNRNTQPITSNCPIPG